MFITVVNIYSGNSNSQTIPLGQGKILLQCLGKHCPNYCMLSILYFLFDFQKCPETLSYSTNPDPSFPVLLQDKVSIFSRPQVLLFVICLAGLAESSRQGLRAILVGIGWP